ncbi:MAG: hypothetical protein NTX17_01075 [Candidatus Eisenbacteria bacterium]|nr:hypothetical protein [Candidatus Eisenbacteria bacterium]
MKRFLAMWVILMLGLLMFGGLVVAQEEEEEATQTKTIETRIMTQAPSSCQFMMQPMAGMTGSMCQGSMGCGMMGGNACCGMTSGGMMGCGKSGARGQCGMQGGMGCGPCCQQLHELGCPSHLVGMAGELELSEKQITELKAICAAHKKEVVRKQADLKIVGMELDEIVGLPGVDLAKVKAKMMEICSMRQSMCLAQLATIEKAQKVLTAAQMTKFKEMKKEMSCPAGKPGTMSRVKKHIKVNVEE